MSGFQQRTEIIKNWVEIVAIIFAGVWATFTFIIKDSPNLHRATEYSTEIFLDTLGVDSVVLEVVATFKNIGHSVVRVDSSRIDYWLLPKDSVIAEPYFSADDVIINRRNSPDYTLNFYALSGEYTPDQENHQTYDFFLPRDPHTVIVCRTLHYVSRSGFLSGQETSELSSYSYRLECIPDKNEKENP